MNSKSDIDCSLNEISNYLCNQGISNDVQEVYVSLVSQIIAWKQEIDRPLVQGILGGQGTGKTTLCHLLCKLLKMAGYSTVSLSLDDLYKSYADRQELQAKEPRLRWRGPPGTHDIPLGIEVLEQVRLGDPRMLIALPRFDKSLWGGMGDRLTPELITPPDIILFEGWFIGVPPIDDKEINFSQAPELGARESDRPFTQFINQQLQNYLPLWEKIDRLILLYPENYRLCLQWRLQAEQEMIALGKPGMNLAEVTEFVEYFWQALPPELFITPLTVQPTPVDLVIPINSNHSFGQGYFPF